MRIVSIFWLSFGEVEKADDDFLLERPDVCGYLKSCFRN